MPRPSRRLDHHDSHHERPIAGFTFLVYIAAGVTSLVLVGRVARGGAIADKLASVVPATFFAVGSMLFSRGRMIPIPLACLGVVASVLLVVCLPLTLAGFLHGPIF